MNWQQVENAAEGAFLPYAVCLYTPAASRTSICAWHRDCTRKTHKDGIGSRKVPQEHI